MLNLLKDDYPILFEGLHSCYYIDDTRLRKRLKFTGKVISNIVIISTCSKSMLTFRNRLYFLLASAKLRLYQKVSAACQPNAGRIAARHRLSSEQHFPGKIIHHLPSFHANEHVSILPGKGDYALYHGNIEVPENEFAATYLITKVFDGS